MENPIQISTPPPAIEKASSETPKTCSTLVPASAATTRMTSTASAALVASVICGARLTGLDLREHGPADQRIYQRKNRHYRLKVLFHLCGAPEVDVKRFPRRKVDPSHSSCCSLLGFFLPFVLQTLKGD